MNDLQKFAVIIDAEERQFIMSCARDLDSTDPRLIAIAMRVARSMAAATEVQPGSGDMVEAD